MNENDPWNLTPRDVAAQLGIHKETVIVWANAMKIPCTRLPNGHRRFRQSDVDAIVALGRA